ncbi:MAG: methyl-accepting chemotaxis protein [Defluviitaleaceae bacterium]|nr:methyl-accepting chemotaxis protein [Defluviitaleaceae bacterium]
MFRSLKAKIIAPVIVILLLMVGIIVIYVSSTTAGLVEDLFNERLEAASTSVRAYLSSNERQTFLAANSMGSSSELIRRLNEGTREQVWQYAFDQKNHMGVSEIIIADANGITVARSHMRDSYGDDVSGVPSIAAGLRGEQRTMYVRTPTAEMVMTTSSPIMDGGTLVGAVVVNFTIGSAAFLDYIKNTFDVDVTVFRLDPATGDAMSVMTTLINPATGDRLYGTPANRDLVTYPVIGRGEHIILDLNIMGIMPYRAYYFPLPGPDGSPNGIFFVGISRQIALDTTASLRNVLIAISAVSLIVAIGLLFAIVVNLLKPLKILGENVKDVTMGNFNFNMSPVSVSNDEIGLLKGDIYSMVNMIKHMIDDLEVFNREASIHGDLDYRLDTDRYYGAYKEMLDSMNKYADSISGDIKLTVDILGKITDGDHDLNITKLPGKKAQLSDSLQALENNINSVHDAVMEVSNNAAKGNFDVTVDASRFKGGWAEMLKGLDAFTSDVKKPLNEIRDVLNRVGQGLFDGKVEGTYQGDFLEIKNDLNAVIKSLGSYINEIDRCLNALSSGDLTFKINLQMTGDFSQIQNSIQRINSSLSKTMSEISGASGKVLQSSRQITSSANDLANGAQTQASSVEELNASIDMINQQTMQNAENADTANTLSNKSTQNAQEGNDAMKKMLHAMTEIKESSNNISKIIKVIQDIAFQTNLLALNAAVEAARAGEHGKGFAVVAEEVRNLAARSQTAATETTGLITDSLNRVDVGSGIAESTAGTLDVIVKNANEVLQIINSISASSKEQADAISQISGGINQISQVVQTNSASSQETAASAEELTSQSELLQNLVAYFKF